MRYRFRNIEAVEPVFIQHLKMVDLRQIDNEGMDFNLSGENLPEHPGRFRLTALHPRRITVGIAAVLITAKVVDQKDATLPARVQNTTDALPVANIRLVMTQIRGIGDNEGRFGFWRRLLQCNRCDAPVRQAPLDQGCRFGVVVRGNQNLDGGIAL